MKKFLIITTVCVGFMFSSCNLQLKKFVATDVETVTIKDGAGNPVEINVKNSLGVDTADVINKLVSSEDEYTRFISGIFWNLKNLCNNPRTFKPEKLGLLLMQDTIFYKDEKIYNFIVRAQGVAKNAYGVEGDVQEYLDLIAWKEVIAHDYVDWSIYPNNQSWLEFMNQRIDDSVVRKDK